MVSGRYPKGSNSVTRCPRCGGASQIENTEKQDTRYVKRLRGCSTCGTTWSTAELPLADVKRLRALERFLKDLRV